MCMIYFRIILFTLLITTQADTLIAKMYKWVDQEGKVTYSNEAPPSSAQQIKTTTVTDEYSSNASFASAAGKYFRGKNRDKNFIELHSDGSFLLYMRANRQSRGKYKINDKKITFFHDGHEPESGTIENNVRITFYGRKWKKDLSKKQQIAASTIPTSSAQQGGTTLKTGSDDPIMNPSLIVSGMIKDRSGQTLSDVNIRVRESYLTSNYGEYNRERSLLVHDGNFEIACKECSAMSLRFTKKGYYPAKAMAGVFDNLSRLSESELKTISQGGAIPPMPTVEKENMEVVLEQIQHKQSIHLRQSGAVLFSGPDLDDIVAALKGMTVTAMPLSVIQAKAGSGESPLYIKLEPTLDNSGQILAVQAQSHPVPAPTILDFSHADGGIIVYHPSTSVMNMALREMKTAPENGYVSRIKVPHLRGEEIYFYCRFNGIYGKGRITGVRFKYASGNRKGIGLGITLYLNPDGSRNLEDVRY